MNLEIIINIDTLLCFEYHNYFIFRNDPMTEAVDEVAHEISNGDSIKREIVISELFSKLRDNSSKVSKDAPSKDLR